MSGRMVHYRAGDNEWTACGVRVAIGSGDSAVVVRARGRIRCSSNVEDVTCRRCLATRRGDETEWTDGS